MKLVCKNVGWDGEGFYCMRCGKAGFQTEAQARGHLSQCKGRAVQRGLVPVFKNPFSVSSEQVLPPVSNVGGAGGVMYSLSGAGGGADGGAGQIAFPGSQVLGYPSYWPDLDNRVRQLENEYSHLLLDRNTPRQDWLGGLLNNKGFVILCVGLLFVLLVSRVGCGSANPSRGVLSNIGERALAKLTDKAITKSVDSIFG